MYGNTGKKKGKKNWITITPKRSSNKSTNIESIAIECSAIGLKNRLLIPLHAKYAPAINFNSYLTDTDECASIPCQNGGSCNDQLNKFTCQCAEGWTGTTCQTSKIKFIWQINWSLYILNARASSVWCDEHEYKDKVVEDGKYNLYRKIVDRKIEKFIILFIGITDKYLNILMLTIFLWNLTWQH